ncbi:M23 family metallopeptidase [Arthrobacter sp. PAMC25284]|nr:M23 family metallopeptidase [Arthrobacter sp. PAMC25284]
MARTVAVRWLSGGVCLSLAVLTFGLQGLAGSASSSSLRGAFTASGAVGPQSLDLTALMDSALMDTAQPVAGAAFTADERALVAFSRSAVGTASKEGVSGEFNVASASLKRPGAGTLMSPLESLLASSPFGLRTSPISGSAGEFHWGQDFAAACGTRVYAADSGVVRAVGWHPWGGGNRVEIDHGNGLITTYNHLEAIAVKKGDSVRVDEIIAKVGTTGSSTGCHLHFETILNGKHVNPQDWSLLPTRQVDPLGPLTMTSYEPDAGLPANNRAGWAIPVSEKLTHIVAGGLNERPAAVVVEAATQPPPVPVKGGQVTSSPTAPGTATPPAKVTATPTPGPATPTPATPTPGPATPTPATPTPGTATPTPATPTPGTATTTPGTATTTPGTATPTPATPTTSPTTTGTATPPLTAGPSGAATSPGASATPPAAATPSATTAPPAATKPVATTQSAAPSQAPPPASAPAGSTAASAKAATTKPPAAPPAVVPPAAPPGVVPSAATTVPGAPAAPVTKTAATPGTKSATPQPSKAAATPRP